jgi:anti-sigma-K factor RskA
MSLENLQPEERDLQYELYALGLLDAESMAEIRALVEAGDAEAVRGVSRAMALTSSLAYVAPEKNAPKALRRRLLLAAGAKERGRGWAWILGLAATCAALLAIVFNIRQDVERREAQIAVLEKELTENRALVAQARDLYDFLRQPGTINVKFGDGQPAPPRGQVFLNRERGVLLFAGNLPAMPVGKVFEMWFVPKGGGAPIPAGLFRAENGQGVHFQRGPVDPASIAAIAVTLEPEAGSTSPTLPILFAAPVQAE